MQQSEALRTFSSACEWFLSSMAKDEPLTKSGAQIVEYYCHEILQKIAPSLTDHPRSNCESALPKGG